MVELTISLYVEEVGTSVGSTLPTSKTTYETSSSSSYSSSGPKASTCLYPGQRVEGAFMMNVRDLVVTPCLAVAYFLSTLTLLYASALH